VLLHRHCTPILTWPSLHFTTHKYPSRYAPIYPLHWTTLHLISLHFNIILTHSFFLQLTILITFLTLFLKAFGLQGRVSKISAGNQFHIQELDVLVSCRLNFWYYYSRFWVCVLWNVVPSRPFSSCSWHDQSSSSSCARLFPSICSSSLPELIDPLKYNLAVPSLGPS